MKSPTALALTIAAFASTMVGAITVAPATAAPAPIPPPAFPIPPTRPTAVFSTEQSRLVATVTGLPRGEKFCLFEGYYGDPYFGSLGVNVWNPLYQKYELMHGFKIRSTPKPPGVYPVRIRCRMQTQTLLYRHGVVRIPNTAR